MTQTFGSILGIIALVTITYKDTIKNKDLDGKAIFKKIRNFVALYTTIILLSIFGMVSRVSPPLDPFPYSGELASFWEAIPLIIFLNTVLLSVLALVCLGRLIIDLIT
jgi:hypothetical protein